jgi:hypothetical protein
MDPRLAVMAAFGVYDVGPFGLPSSGAHMKIGKPTGHGRRCSRPLDERKARRARKQARRKS